MEYFSHNMWKREKKEISDEVFWDYSNGIQNSLIKIITEADEIFKTMVGFYLTFSLKSSIF